MVNEMEVKPVYLPNKDLVDSQQVDLRHTESQQGELPTDLPAEATLEQKVIAAIRTVYDPEIHVNIYDLGLIYDININHQAEAEIEMTLTAPACPVAEILPAQVAAAVKEVDGIHDANVTLVWEPPWCQENISEAARLELGLL